MVIVDERDFIGKALQEKGLDVFDFYDGYQAISVQDLADRPMMRLPDVLLMDTRSLLNHPSLIESIKAHMNTFQGVFFFRSQEDKEAGQWVESEATFLTKIVGACSLPMSELDWSILTNQLRTFWNLNEEQRLLQKHMAEFSQELDQVLQSAEWEMTRAKKIHEALIPKRSEEIKGVRFLSKYATGEGGGGEFFDLIQTQNKVFQVLVASESYLISSSLMGLLNTHKKQDFDPEGFLTEAKDEIKAINASKKKAAKVDLLILELDLTQLNLKAYGDQKAEFYSQSRGAVSLAQGTTVQLGKGEKFIVFSPGFLFNWKENAHKQDIWSFIKDHRSQSLQELMTELFFQIRQENKGPFLVKDATVVMMEVHRHGMHQV